MINYCTRVDIPQSDFRISYKDSLLFLGSCFADLIGAKMKSHGWDVCINPFGVLYNPLSVAAGCKRILQPAPFTKDELFEYNGLYHSFMHQEHFSDRSVEATLTKINSALLTAAEHLSKASCLVITFGTAYVYRHKTDGSVVANCHKLPAATFDRALLSVEQIVAEWSALLDVLLSVNDRLKIIFTVSPIRHWKDGAHGNQLSKSILLLSQQAMSEKFHSHVVYFPAYELMMDELRDYRFYADDLLHPSKVAVDYIWERFCEVYLDSETTEDLNEVESILRDINHRPFHPSSDSHKQFLKQALDKIKRIKAKNPTIYMAKEEKEITDRLQELV